MQLDPRRQEGAIPFNLKPQIWRFLEIKKLQAKFVLNNCLYLFPKQCVISKYRSKPFRSDIFASPPPHCFLLKTSYNGFILKRSNIHNVKFKLNAKLRQMTNLSTAHLELKDHPNLRDLFYHQNRLIIWHCKSNSYCFLRLIRAKPNNIVDQVFNKSLSHKCHFFARVRVELTLPG